MEGDPVLFVQAFSHAFATISKNRDTSIGFLQDELGYFLGNSGGSAVRRMLKGNPPKEEVVRKIAVFFHTTYPADLDRDWYDTFLKSVGYYHASSLLHELFPSTPVAGRADGKTGAPALPTEPSPGKTSGVYNYLFTEKFTLPLSEKPSLGVLPAHSREIPFHYNRIFVDRKKQLRRLAKLLLDGKVAVVSGVAGVGKTHLVNEFAHRYGAYFPGGVFWLSFASPEDIPAEVAECGRVMELSSLLEFDALSQSEQVVMVQSAWQKPVPRLLIFDSCEDVALLQKWQPKTGGCYVLVTSRRDQWLTDTGVEQLLLRSLTKHQSIAFLQKYRPTLSDDEAADIAVALGNLPLGLHFAGSFLETFENIAPNAFLHQLHDMGIKHPSLAGYKDTYSTPGGTSLIETYELSYQALDPENAQDALALAFLARAAQFAPGERILQSMLIDTLGREQEGMDDMAIGDGLNRLGNLGFILYTGEQTIYIHRLIAQFLVWRTQDDTAARNAVETVLLHEARTLNAFENPVGFKQWVAHLRHVTEQANDREDALAAGLAYEFGTYLRVMGEYSNAHLYLERAWKIKRSLLGETHLDTIVNLNDVGVVLGEMGLLEEARKTTQQAIEFWKKTGHTTIHTAESYNNMGLLLSNLGQPEEAINYYTTALELCTQSSLPEKLLQGKVLNNIGSTLQQLSLFEEGVEKYAQAKEIWEENLEKCHPYLGVILNNLGTVHWRLQNFQQAKTYLEQALDVYRKTLGENHPRTIIAHNNLGAILRDSGDYTLAKRHLTTAWDAYMKLWPDDVNRANVLRNFGMLFQAQGLVDQAGKYYKDALAILIAWREGGYEHPLIKDVTKRLESLTNSSSD